MANRKFRIKRGASRPMTITVPDRNGVAVDLSDYTVEFVVTEIGETTAIIGGTMTNDADQVANTGVCEYWFDGEETIDLTPAKYDLELRVTDELGDLVDLYPCVDGTTFGTFEIVESKVELYDDLPIRTIGGGNAYTDEFGNDTGGGGA